MKLLFMLNHEAALGEPLNIQSHWHRHLVLQVVVLVGRMSILHRL